MSSWFSEKVGNLVRDVQRQASQVGTGSGPRSADELAAELEQQARRVSGPQNAAELLARWVERSEVGQSSFPLGAAGEGSHGLAEPLSFYQALLRSQAFEVLLEACSKVPSLRSELAREAEAGLLSQTLRLVAERLLLPGALALWPSLLEALLVGEDGLALESKCRPWARRALALVKRQWQSETLPGALRCLDRKLTALVARQPAEEGEQLLRPAANRMSKGAIRAAMALDKLRRHAAAAAMLRAKTELLCDACARLEAAESGGAMTVPEVEKLLSDADEMLATLDAGVKAQLEEQESLRTSLSDVTAALEDQISQFQETLASFNEKRGPLQDERAALVRRLEEVNMQILQIDEATATYEKKARGLAGQLRETTKHYEEKIAQSFRQQKRLADEKLRAVACKECGNTVLDVVRGEEQRRSVELAAQLRKRRSELQRACAAYVREERSRLEAVAEYVIEQPEPSPRVEVSDGGALLRPGAHEGKRVPGSDAVTAAAVVDAWQAAQAVLRRAVPLLEAVTGAPAPSALRGSASEASPEEAQALFARARHCCVDCGLPGADWASLSYGTYLCVDCAGRHRGLGVHLSFVRSTTMDLWTGEQLRRMQLGGTERFLDFLRPYPQLREPPRTAAELSLRYSSRAAACYRQLLDARCEGGNALDLEVPPPDQGHLPAEEGGTDAAVGTKPAEGDDGEHIMSVEAEQAALEAAYRKYQERLNLPAVSRTGSKSATASTVATAPSVGASVAGHSAPEVSAVLVAPANADGLLERQGSHGPETLLETRAITGPAERLGQGEGASQIPAATTPGANPVERAEGPAAVEVVSTPAERADVVEGPAGAALPVAPEDVSVSAPTRTSGGVPAAPEGASARAHSGAVPRSGAQTVGQASYDGAAEDVFG